eukprot:582560-Alexandrium_andersonii.AAC.1
MSSRSEEERRFLEAWVALMGLRPVIREANAPRGSDPTTFDLSGTRVQHICLLSACVCGSKTSGGPSGTAAAG